MRATWKMGKVLSSTCRLYNTKVNHFRYGEAIKNQLILANKLASHCSKLGLKLFNIQFNWLLRALYFVDIFSFAYEKSGTLYPFYCNIFNIPDFEQG